MHKMLAAVLLALSVSTAQAIPISFTSSLYTTFAFADVGGESDGPDDGLSPDDPLPLLSFASVDIAAGTATAEATADDLLLTASTAATFVTDLASAAATATFLGEFISPGGSIALQVAFDDAASGFAGASLGVILAVEGAPLFDEIFFVPTRIDLAFPVPADLTGTLEITLFSNALAFSDLQPASDTTAVRFALDAVAVPEPAVLALVALALGLLAATRGRSGT
ncbi:MAG TPA: hypothetical protein PL143_15045 [Rhodocyclaceae bacterium]|nr:hypothetical protein [Rhodocyclaceae bacterium]